MCGGGGDGGEGDGGVIEAVCVRILDKTRQGPKRVLCFVFFLDVMSTAQGERGYTQTLLVRNATRVYSI